MFVCVVMAGLVPAIPIEKAKQCPPKRDARVIGVRKHAVLRTAMPAHDAETVAWE
jgi:hypothetical protein